MATWEKVLLAAMTVGLLVWWFPRARAGLAASPKGTRSDWLLALTILALVGLFVALLMAAV